MRYILLAALAFSHAAAAQSTTAQSLPCAPRDRVLDFIQGDLGQTRYATGHAGQGAQMETFADDRGGWTIIVTLPNGQSCLLAAGDVFDSAPTAQAPRGQES